MKICVVGSGYVGLVAAVGFCELGHEVICVDNDLKKLAKLSSGIATIHEEFLPELLANHIHKGLRFTADLGVAVKESKAIFIAVGTPPASNGDADLSYVEAVARDVAVAVGGDCKPENYKVIVEKSTVPVYTNNWIQRVLILNGAAAGNIDVVSNPEFLREGTAVVDFLYPDRIVVGADSAKAAAMMAEIYEPLTSGSYYQSSKTIPGPLGFKRARLIQTSTKSAELIKHASNAFLATKISFINAVATVCEAVGADIEEVAEGIGSDSRIGSRFLRPGIGYGGSCFPKDLKAFYAIAQQTGYEFRLLREVEEINQQQRERYLKKVKDALWTLKGKKLGVLGLAFKGGTDDVRESPAFPIIEELLREGCDIAAYDPAALDTAKEVLPPQKNLSYASTAFEAIEGRDALLILTDWEEFSQLDLARVKRELRYPVVIDGRNLYDPAKVADAGLLYLSIGRDDALPTGHPIADVSSPGRRMSAGSGSSKS